MCRLVRVANVPAACPVVVPVTLLIIFLLLYLNFRRLTETLIVMLSLPFSLVGGLWLLWALGFNLSVAVGVGLIALRTREPNAPRPFRMWLYPVPALLSIVGFAFLLISRENFSHSR